MPLYILSSMRSGKPNTQHSPLQRSANRSAATLAGSISRSYSNRSPQEAPVRHISGRTRSLAPWPSAWSIKRVISASFLLMSPGLPEAGEPAIIFNILPPRCLLDNIAYRGYQSNCKICAPFFLYSVHAV